MKKVAVNTRLLLKGRLEGLGTYKMEVLKRLVANHPGVEFHFIFDRAYDQEFIFGENVVPHVIGPPARHPFLFIWWFNYSLPRLLRKIKPDVFFSPDGYLSLRTKVPQVPVIHDINFFHFPRNFPFWVRWHYNTYFPQFAQKAHKIITVSDFSKTDIAKNYRIAQEKIEVVYNGIEQERLDLSESEIDEIRGKYSEGKPYFVFIGALYPRKNLENQLLAFDKFKSQSGSDMKFIIIGKSYPESENILATHRSLNFKEDVRFIGRVDSRDEVNRILGGALACSYVSRFEGFGLPILESMRVGTPVITANTSALPEVAADAAVLVNPESVDEITAAYQSMVNDENLRAALKQKGRNRIKKFNWDEAAASIAKVLKI